MAIHSASKMLSKSNRDHMIPVVDSKTLEVEELLGVGGFGSVFHVRVNLDLLDLHQSSKDPRCTTEDEDVSHHLPALHQDALHIIESLSSFNGSFFSVESTETRYESYALKRISTKVMQFPKKRLSAGRSLRNEARLLSLLPTHKHIIQLVGVSEKFWADDFDQRTQTTQLSRWYLILEKLDTTLDQKLKEWKTLPNEISALPSSNPMSILGAHKRKRALRRAMQANRIKESGLAQVAGALAFLHEHNILFRDLKPANVGFLCGQAKLFDFGLARTLPSSNEHYRLTLCVGTARYMAPEVICFPDYAPAADVYSFGTMLWEVCALETPFDENASSEEILQTILVFGGRGLCIHNVGLVASPKLKTLVQKCWSRNETKRPKFGSIAQVLDSEAAFQ